MKHQKTTQIVITILILWAFAPFISKGISPDSTIILIRSTDTAIVPEHAVVDVSRIDSNAYYGWSGYNHSYKGVIKNGSCRISLPKKGQLFYVVVTLELPNGKRILVNEENDAEIPYLMDSSDQLTITFKTQKRLVFSGKGAEKLKCQQQIYQLKYLPRPCSDRLIDLGNQKDLGKALETRAKFLKLHLDTKLAILDSYRGQLDSNVYQMIRYDCLGKFLLGLYGPFVSPLALSDFQHQREVAHAAIEEYSRKYDAEPTGDRQEALSIYYFKGLLLKEQAKLLLSPLAKRKSLSIDFHAFYLAIQNKYSGALRDKLYLGSIFQFANKESETSTYPDLMLKDMADGISKTMLMRWKSHNGTGNKAFPFSLPDEYGKIHRLTDFKGKIIVADFWFRGCRPCMGMAKVLATVVKHYAQNQQVVFLSINVDRRKADWEAGLKDGLYTFPGAIHLSTYGENRNAHPLLEYYNYSACPQLLLIDENGLNLSANPPDPRADKGIKLMELIDQKL